MHVLRAGVRLFLIRKTIFISFINRGSSRPCEVVYWMIFWVSEKRKRPSFIFQKDRQHTLLYNAYITIYHLVMFTYLVPFLPFLYFLHINGVFLQILAILCWKRYQNVQYPFLGQFWRNFDILPKNVDFCYGHFDHMNLFSFLQKEFTSEKLWNWSNWRINLFWELWIFS